jgi:hypothetical protein
MDQSHDLLAVLADDGRWQRYEPDFLLPAPRPTV